MTLLTLLLHRDHIGVTVDCTFTYDVLEGALYSITDTNSYTVTAGSTYALAAGNTYAVTDGSTYDPCADD